MQINLRTQELIAIGAAVTANCQPCLEYHAAKAAENGVEQGEIADAIEVGRRVRKGAAAKFDKFALQHVRLADAGPASEEGGCGCRQARRAE